MSRCIIAYAESPESSNVSLVLILASVAIVAAVAGLAFVPMLISWRRRHRRSDAIVGVAVVWALLAAGSGVVATVQQMNWSRERSMRIESGYYDPRDAEGEAPALPCTTWAALAGGYAAVVGWACMGRAAHDR